MVEKINLAKVQGEFVWQHADEDELFIVIRGELTIELRDGAVTLGPGELVVIPKGVEHRPVAKEEVQLMLIEPKAIRHTGDVESEMTVHELARIWSVVHPELRHIRSFDLEPPALPADPRDCAVRFQVLIGPRGGVESESFTFTAVTPGHLARIAGGRWGRGSLMLATFDWESVSRAIAQLLVSSARPTWDEVATELNRVLDWEIGHRHGSGE